MKCHVCNEEHGDGYLTPLGFACRACGDASTAEWKAICDKERGLPIDDGPDDYDMAEFERFALRLALHFLEQESLVEKLKQSNPMMCCPSEFALWIKEQIIQVAPKHFSTWEARGHSRIFHGGTFRIIGTLRKSDVIAAAQEAGLLIAKGGDA